MAAYISFQPSDYFNTVLYTGTGSSNAVTGVGFTQDFTWIKERDNTYNHIVVDTVRGATKYFKFNSSSAETTDATYVASLDSDGFTVGTNANTNESTNLFASWNWKMGTTSGLTGGSITPTAYSLNTTAGQSIIAYTGTGSAATVPHGLGKVPQMLIIKALDLGHDSIAYSEVIGNTYYMKFSNAEAKSNSYGAAAWNNTSPTTTVFSEGGNTHLGGSGNPYIAYCFTSIKGYSKFGGYIGNGNINGPFIYTGFRPAFVVCKRTDSAQDWMLYDSKRLGYNDANEYFEVNDTAVENDNVPIDILSNGFKIRHTSASVNAAAGDYIYMAFAEFPPR